MLLVDESSPYIYRDKRYEMTAYARRLFEDGVTARFEGYWPTLRVVGVCCGRPQYCIHAINPYMYGLDNRGSSHAITITGDPSK